MPRIIRVCCRCRNNHNYPICPRCRHRPCRKCPDYPYADRLYKLLRADRASNGGTRRVIPIESLLSLRFWRGLGFGFRKLLWGLDRARERAVLVDFTKNPQIEEIEDKPYARWCCQCDAKHDKAWCPRCGHMLCVFCDDRDDRASGDESSEYASTDDEVECEEYGECEDCEDGEMGA